MPELSKTTADLEWLLKTSVPSTLVDGGEWLWQAKVLVNPQSTTGHITLGRTECKNPTLAREDSIPSISHNSHTLRGKSGIPSDQFEQLIQRWELECLSRSTSLDDSIDVQRTKRQHDHDRRNQGQADLQAAKDLLDRLVEQSAQNQTKPRTRRNLLFRLFHRASR